MKIETAQVLIDPADALEPETLRLYAGAEFCFWHFPETALLRAFLCRARREHLPLSLLTPVCSEPQHRELLRRLDEIVDELLETDEVVFSDWGTMALLRERAPHLTLVPGRALSGQKRGPQILDLNLSAAELDHFRQNRFSSRSARALLRDCGISRIELDLPPQGLAPQPSDLPAALHVPYAMVTSSGNCPYRDPRDKNACARRCGEVMVLRTAQSRLPLYQCGNTQFLRCDDLPADLEALGIDRIVRHRQLPR